ncbi:hypothetical protein ACFYT3_35210 [Nocardia amikacinitolerans]|uniref:hypothetical protein n=1 Tax=Nocardia amikacinitolerans TaxID=756689 RepID=UPI0020A5D8E8|nr:hypothetical protein [Nocardia amikacinitolerans]MCP2293580.1 hypothetical protein [Nocardia amikacinitolerans]
MSEQASPLPDEPDVHLSVYLHGARFDFAACLAAALLFIQDFRAHHYPDAVQVIPGETAELTRLPNERLYLEP